MFDGFWLRIPDWLLVRPELDLSAKVVYSTLARHARGKMHCWPFMRTIAEQTGLSERTVERATGQLEAAGLIEIERPDDRKAWTRSQLEKVETSGNRYFFLKHDWIPENLFQPEDEAGDRKSVSRPTGSRSNDRQDVGSTTDTVSPTYLKRVSEESTEETNPRLARQARPSVPQTHTAPPRPPSQPAPPDRNQIINSRRTEEHDSSITSESEETDPVKAGLAIAARLKRLRSEVVPGAIAKTEEAHARKLARSFKPKPPKPDNDYEGYEGEQSESTPLGHLSKVWRQTISSVFPNSPVPAKWGGREFGQTKQLLAKYDRDQVEATFGYVIRNWESLRARMFKGRGGPVPTVGLVAHLDDSLFPEAALWATHRDVIAEYNAFGDKYDERPQDLTDRYLEATKALGSLGLKLGTA